jgi:hypothetical protein
MDRPKHKPARSRGTPAAAYLDPMLTAHQTRMLSSNYMIYQDDRFILRWKAYWLHRDGSTFDLGGRPYRVSKSHSQAGEGPHWVSLDGPELGSVTARYENDEAWAITVNGRRYWLRRASFWGRDINLVWDGQVVGSVRFAGRLRKVVAAHLPVQMSLPVQIFVVGWALMR